MIVNQINNEFPAIFDQDIDFDAPPVGLYDLNSNELVPIKFADVNADINDNFAKVIIKHHYENLFSQPIDTEFVFPKTKNAIFSSLKASLDNGEEIFAEILSYQEGNKKFNEAKEKGDLAILADIDKTKPDLVRTKIGNIAPGQKVKITFSYVTQLDISVDKYYQFKFANIFIPRYVCKSKNIFDEEKNFEILPKIKFLTEADIGILNEEYNKLLIQNPNNNDFLEHFENYFINKKEFIQYNSGTGMLFPWSMRINLNTTFNFSNLKYNNYLKNDNEKLFNVQIINENNNNQNNSAILTSSALNFDYPKTDVIISFEDEKGFKLPKLLLNQHPLIRNEFSLYFKFNPKFLSEPKANAVFDINKLNIKEEVVGCYLFVIDRSGSMAGSRMQTAKDSLVYFLKSLPEKSQFNVVSFGSDYQLLYPDFIQANDKTIKEALKKIEQFKADLGGTELYKPFARIFEDWKKNMKKYQNNKILRAFVLTDGSIDNPDGFLKLLENELNYIGKNGVDLRIYSLGIGSGCSEYLIKGIAEKGQGKSELAINNDDIVEKVIYLLDDSMKKNLKNFKIYFENNNKLNDSLISNSNLPAGEFNTAFKTFTETIEFFSRIEIDDKSLKTLEDITLIISYEDVDKTEEKFPISLDKNIIQDDDTIFKIWVNQKVDKYFDKLAKLEKDEGYRYNYENKNVLDKLKNQLIELSIKYQCLNRLTSLFMVLKEKNVDKKELKEKKFISLSNSDIKELEVHHYEEEAYMSQFNNSKSTISSYMNYPPLHEPTAVKKKSGGLFSSIGNAFSGITGLFGSKSPSLIARSSNTFSNSNQNMNKNLNFSKKSSTLFSNQNKSMNITDKESKKNKSGMHSKKAETISYPLFGKEKGEASFNKNSIFNNKMEMECEENDDMEIDDFSEDFSHPKKMEFECESFGYTEKSGPIMSPSIPSNLSIPSQIKKESKKSVQIKSPGSNQSIIKSNLQSIESEILMQQNFNGSWNKSPVLLSSMNLQNWDVISLEFTQKYQDKFNNKDKDQQEIIIFTLYVLNFVKYKISEQKILNKLKLIISKGEKFVINQLQENNPYNIEFKLIFGF